MLRFILLLAIAAIIFGFVMRMLAESKERKRAGGLLRPNAPPRYPVPPALTAKVRLIVKTQGTIEAIRFYREASGASLKDAKEAIDYLMAQPEADDEMPAASPEHYETAALPPDRRLSPEARRAVEDLIRRGDLIAAIQAYRDATGDDLREAKEAVDRIRLELRASGQ